MSNPFARVALDPRLEWSPLLIRPVVVALQGVRGASRAVIISSGCVMRAVLGGITTARIEAMIRVVPIWLVEAVDAGAISLDMAEMEFVIVVVIPRGFRESQTVDLQGVYVPDTMLDILVHCHSNLVNAQVIGEKAIIVGVAVGVNHGLNICDDVSIVQRFDRMEEDVGTVARGKEDILLCLEAEVEDVSLTEVQNSGVPGPEWLCDWDSGVEPRDEELKNPPE